MDLHFTRQVSVFETCLVKCKAIVMWFRSVNTETDIGNEIVRGIQ